MSLDKLKIIQVVTFNDGEAWVLNRTPELEYERHGDTIIGMDFPFFECLYYQKPTGRFKAFAGREFFIRLVNGENVQCYGQWWSGITSFTKQLIGDEIGYVTAGGFEDLRRCYVFTGYIGSKNEFLNFRSEYNGQVIPYWDYEKKLRE